MSSNDAVATVLQESSKKELGNSNEAHRGRGHRRSRSARGRSMVPKHGLSNRSATPRGRGRMKSMPRHKNCQWISPPRVKGNVSGMVARIPSGSKTAFLQVTPQNDDRLGSLKCPPFQRGGQQLLLQSATIGLRRLYSFVNPEFDTKMEQTQMPALTNPSEGVLNDGYDNVNSELILRLHQLIESDDDGIKPRRFKVQALVGHGTFGQVCRCVNVETGEEVAIKIIKNKPAYYTQAFLEIRILKTLNEDCDPRDQFHIVRLYDHFMYKNHLCLVFELLGANLYELIKFNNHKGINSRSLVFLLQQLVPSLILLKNVGIIHCDLKPENILMSKVGEPRIKVIDFGSACWEYQTVYSYIQSRFYRSPEVLLSVPYTSAIDSWSLGCIAAELFLGLPLFSGENELNQLSLIIDMRGFPPIHMLENGRKTSSFFNISREASEAVYTLKTPEQYARANGLAQVVPVKKRFRGTTLSEVIMGYAMRDEWSEAEREAELYFRRKFVHFLSGLLRLDPESRWTPDQAIQHPLLTGMQFDGCWDPQGLRPRSRTLPDLRLGTFVQRSAPLSDFTIAPTGMSDALSPQFLSSFENPNLVGMHSQDQDPASVPPGGMLGMNFQHHSFPMQQQIMGPRTVPRLHSHLFHHRNILSYRNSLHDAGMLQSPVMLQRPPSHQRSHDVNSQRGYAAMYAGQQGMSSNERSNWKIDHSGHGLSHLRLDSLASSSPYETADSVASRMAWMNINRGRLDQPQAILQQPHEFNAFVHQPFLPSRRRNSTIIPPEFIPLRPEHHPHRRSIVYGASSPSANGIAFVAMQVQPQPLPSVYGAVEAEAAWDPYFAEVASPSHDAMVQSQPGPYAHNLSYATQLPASAVLPQSPHNLLMSGVAFPSSGMECIPIHQADPNSLNISNNHSPQVRGVPVLHSTVLECLQQQQVQTPQPDSQSNYPWLMKNTQRQPDR